MLCMYGTTHIYNIYVMLCMYSTTHTHTHTQIYIYIYITVRYMKKKHRYLPVWIMGCAMRQGGLVADMAVARAAASGSTSSMMPKASMYPRFRSRPMRLTNSPSSVARQSGSHASTNALSCKLVSAALMWEMSGGSRTCVCTVRYGSTYGRIDPQLYKYDAESLLHYIYIYMYIIHIHTYNIYIYIYIIHIHI